MNKILIITSILLYMLISINTQAQTYYGHDAHLKVNGSECVRISDRSEIPSYIKFTEASQFPLGRLESYLKNEFKLSNEFRFQCYQTDNGSDKEQVHRFAQFYNNAKIKDARFNVLVKNDMVVSISGFVYNQMNVQNSPVISPETGLQAALKASGAEVYKWEIEAEEALLKEQLSNPEATHYPKSELVLFPSEYPRFSGAYKYAHKFIVYAAKPLSKKEYYIDAQNGTVLYSFNLLQSADVPAIAETKYSGTRTITTDSTMSGYRLRETSRGNGIETYNLNTNTNLSLAVDFTDSDNYWNNYNSLLDEVATDVHWAAESTYDYYLTTHNRNSIDNNGYAIRSYVHYDSAYNNAFFDGVNFCYGDGENGQVPLTTLDIIAHEITHGLTAYTANLDYAYESGALNEGFSDIFGTSTEFFKKPLNANWIVGDTVAAVRSMADPNLYYQPDTYLGGLWHSGVADYGGVHINCGVINYWYYLLSEGGSGANDLGNAFAVNGIGVEDASLIAYRCLATYLTNSSQFVDARFYTIQSAIDLYGACSDEVEAVTSAWYAVGVGADYVDYVFSNYGADFHEFCSAPAMVQFENQSLNGLTFLWNFGDGTTSTDFEPSHNYSLPGMYDVSLIIDGGSCGADTLINTAFVSIDPSNPCVEILSADGQAQAASACSGTVYDCGGTGAYNNATDYTMVISPTSATSVTLNFLSFDFEVGFDYLYIYDGADTLSPLIGQFDGTALPNGGMITSSGPSICIRQKTDQYITGQGFQLEWICNLSNAAPLANFYADETESCSGSVSFNDISLNNANSWFWNFGDGNTSTDQFPTHQYLLEGNYSVTLIASNSYGADTLVMSNYVNVFFPETPMAHPSESCSAGNLEITSTGAGVKAWYADSMGEELLSCGDTFTTPYLTQNTEFYVAAYAFEELTNTGRLDNSGIGNMYPNINKQFLVFDCYTDVTLLSVKVYAGSSGNRMITLNDKNGNMLQEKEVFIPEGESRIYLNFHIAEGEDYQLQGPPEPDLFRNGNLVNEYPYLVEDIISITRSSATPAPYDLAYYYFFYDWEVMRTSCSSQLVPVMASLSQELVSADFNFQLIDNEVNCTNLSANASSYEWDFGDGTTSTEEHPVHAYGANGTYEITLKAFASCGTHIHTQDVTINFNGISLHADETNLVVYPNPGSGRFYVKLESIDADPNSMIQLLNLSGELIWQKQFESIDALNSEQFDLSKAAKGIYYLRIINNSCTQTEKVIIQ